VGQLRDQLKGYSDDHDLIFGNGNLIFLRTTRRSETLVQIEFAQNTENTNDRWSSSEENVF